MFVGCEYFWDNSLLLGPEVLDCLLQRIESFRKLCLLLLNSTSNISTHQASRKHICFFSASLALLWTNFWHYLPPYLRIGQVRIGLSSLQIAAIFGEAFVLHYQIRWWLLCLQNIVPFHSFLNHSEIICLAFQSSIFRGTQPSYILDLQQLLVCAALPTHYHGVVDMLRFNCLLQNYLILSHCWWCLVLES